MQHCNGSAAWQCIPTTNSELIKLFCIHSTNGTGNERKRDEHFPRTFSNRCISRFKFWIHAMDIHYVRMHVMTASKRIIEHRTKGFGGILFEIGNIVYWYPEQCTTKWSLNKMCIWTLGNSHWKSWLLCKTPHRKKNTQTMFWWVQPLFHRHCHNYLCFVIICSFVSISKCYLNSNNSIKAKQNKAKPNKPTGNSDAVWFVLFSTVWLSSRNIFPWCNLDSEAKETLKFVAFLAENIVCLAGPDSYS